MTVTVFTAGTVVLLGLKLPDTTVKPQCGNLLPPRHMEARYSEGELAQHLAVAAQKLSRGFRAQQKRLSVLHQEQKARLKQKAALCQLAVLPWPSHNNCELREIRSSNARGTETVIFKFFCKKFLESCVGHRRDLHATEFCEAPRLEVAHLHAVVNPRLMKLYHSKLEEFREQRPGSCTRVPGFRGFGLLKIPEIKGSDPEKHNLNEYFLFHGSKSAAIDEIWQNGFDPRRGGEGTGNMFGVASYFTPHASKADIYTESLLERLPQGAERRVIIARALLGESYRTTQSMRTAVRPPDGPDGRPLDSVWADTREFGGAVDHPEVMLYDKGQAYPEVIVTYRHEPDCRCAECFKRPR